MTDTERRSPTLLISALVTVDKGVVLLTRHAPNFKWHLPDGEVRFGETLLEALERSFLEDLGVAPLLVGLGPWLVTESVRKDGPHHVVHHFRAAVPKAKPLRCRPGIEMMRFDLIDGFSPQGLLASTVVALRTAAARGML